MLKNLREKNPQTVHELIAAQPRPLDYILKVVMREYERDLDNYSPVSSW